MFSLSGIEDALGGGGGGEAPPAAEQETARDLRCHGAAEPRHAGRHQELPPAALMRYQEYGDAAGEQLPPPTSVAVSSAHDKYAELAAAEADPRYSEHARAAPRTAGRYRNVVDCHEMAGAYGGGSLMSSAGDAQYVVVLKRPGDGDLEKLEPPVSGGDDRRLEQGQALGAQCMVPWYADTATVTSSGSGGGEPAYCEQQLTLAQCRFERDVESAPAEPRYPPLATRSGRDVTCYQVGEGRGAYDPAPYGCETAPLEPLVVVPPSEQTPSLLYSDGRRAELLAKLELSPLQEQCDEQERRFEDHARLEDQGRFDGQGRFEEQGRFDDQGRFEGQGRFEEPGRFEDGSGRFADEAGRFAGDQVRLGEMSQGRFMEPEQGRYAETAGDRFGDVQQARQVDQARFEQLEQARFEQAELARFEQTELARPSESDQVFVYQSDPLRLESVPAPSPPPPQPLPMPAKKRKLDPGLAEELRTIHERNQQSLQEQLRAPPEPEYAAAPVGDHELPAIQEELRGATDPEPRPDAERPHGAAGQEGPSSATPPAGEPNVNHSPKKKRLRRQAPPPPLDREEELGPANTTDLTPLLAVAPAPPSPVPAPPPPQQSPPPPARPEQHACSRCQSVFTLKSALLKHIAAKHRPTDQKKKTFMCNICETTCDKKALYVKHMMTHFEGPPFTCSICFREFPVFSVFLRHRREHGENKPYRCPDCNLSFWKKCNLDHHMRVHTGEKPFQCTICKVTFSLRTTLKQHMNKHSSEKKYTCDECDFSTKYANHLITHKKIHAGDLHRCSHAGCQYTTPKRSHLREHLQSHAKRRSHHCPLCHSTFNVKTHLSRHMRTHDESKQFRCTLCDYTVHRSDRFKSHMATHARPEPKGHRPNAKRVKTQPPPPPPPLPEPAMEVELSSGTPIAAEWDVF